MIKNDDFQISLLKYAQEFLSVLKTSDDNWTVKRFIDIARNMSTVFLLIQKLY
jgi:hypothetical protein